MASIPFHAAIPLYHQIAQLLRQRAGTGGELRATERALCSEFGVSRTTIRQALGMLKQDGLLGSRRGVGTRFVGAGRKRPLVRSSGDPLHAGLGSEPEIIEIAKRVPPPEVTAFLELAEGAAALCIVRLHELDGAPLSVVVSYLPAWLASGVTRAALSKQTLHELLWKRFDLPQKRSVHTIRVGRADARIASLLEIALSDPVLHIQSSAYLQDGRPIRWTDNYFREDRYEYTAEMEWKKPAAGGRRSRHFKGKP
jgi:GntR family transcriptional regulator